GASAAPATATGTVSTLDLLRRLAAERVELPLEAVQPDSHPLDDLHLSSITVGQIINQVTRELGRPALPATTNFATSTLADLAEMLDDLAGTARPGDSGGAGGGVGPAGGGGGPAGGRPPRQRRELDGARAGRPPAGRAAAAGPAAGRHRRRRAALPAGRLRGGPGRAVPDRGPGRAGGARRHPAGGGRAPPPRPRPGQDPAP